MNITFLFIYYAVLALSVDPLSHSAFTPRHLRQLRNRTKVLFQHGWGSYKRHGFPADEVRPISCVPYGPQYTKPDDIHNDVLGNVSLTVLDNLDTLMIMQQWDELESMLQFLEENKDDFFNKDHVVQVFEASIRWLGGLLLAHMALTDLEWKDTKMQEIAKSYNGFLLEMAYDLGLRLIPAYRTSTSLPLPRVNLAKGVDVIPSEKNREACTAGAATPYVEMTILLRLTGDKRFEILTRQTFDKLWAARLSLGLLPMSVDPIGNMWRDMITGIGALVDSFYEYALKGAILFDDDNLWEVFSRSYQSLVSFLAVKSSFNGFTFFANIDTTTGQLVVPWIDLLSAFWPGLQVLAGRLTDAVSSHLMFLKIWDQFDSIPERWFALPTGVENQSNAELVMNAVLLEWYPLRPEFIESTYYLYRATKDPLYLQIGLRVLQLFETRFKQPCGFAGYQDVRTGKMQDRMETFVLGELLKYLYLLFDEANESYVHGAGMKNKNWVFSTEAHPLWMSKEAESRSQKLFKPHLSHRPTQLKTFKGKGIFGSMWRYILTPLNELEPESPQNVEILPTTPRFGPALRPAFEHLLVCETKPGQWNNSRKFLGSGYNEWNQVFAPNEALASTLVRPTHLQKKHENNDIELLDSFLAIYGLSSKPYCALLATAKETEIQIGALVRPEQVEMYRVSEETLDLPFATADLVMPELSGRFRMEHLAEGSVDNYNNRVTQQTLKERFAGVNVPSGGNKLEILLVKFLNGLLIALGMNIWTSAAYLQTNPDVFKITENGNVFLTGLYVQNLKVY